MAKDYTNNLNMVKRLLRDKGRVISLISMNKSSPDLEKPWLQITDALSPEEKETIVSAVGVPPGSAAALGIKIEQEDLLKNLELIYIAEPGEDDTENLNDYHLVKDEGIVYKIKFIQKLRPASLTLLYFIGVER